VPRISKQVSRSMIDKFGWSKYASLASVKLQLPNRLTNRRLTTRETKFSSGAVIPRSLGIDRYLRHAYSHSLKFEYYWQAGWTITLWSGSALWVSVIFFQVQTLLCVGTRFTNLGLVSPAILTWPATFCWRKNSAVLYVRIILASPSLGTFRSQKHSKCQAGPAP
jgi:hypothetical protein